jgi:hypothetical protein
MNDFGDIAERDNPDSETVKASIFICSVARETK